MMYSKDNSLRSKVFIFLTLFLFGYTVCQAQEPRKKDDVTIIKFGKDKKESSPPSALAINIKTGPLSFLSGKAMIEIEKEISSLVSVQGGIGVTFRAFYDGISTLRELTDDQVSFCESEQWDDDLCDVYDDYEVRKAKIGPYLHVSTRLFFDNEGFDGGYIGPSLTYTINRFKVQKAEDISGIVERLENDFQKEFEQRLDFSMRIGYQRLFPKLSVESYIGLGIRKTNALRQDLGYNDQHELQNGERKYQNTDLLMELGIRLGLWQ